MDTYPLERFAVSKKLNTKDFAVGNVVDDYNRRH